MAAFSNTILGLRNAERMTAAPPEALLPDRTAALPLTRRAISWALMLPFVFFATRGNFSFLMDASGNGAPGNSMSDPSASRHLGILGYGVLPGLAYAVVLWLLFTNLRAIGDMALRRRALTMLALLTIVSAAWSQDPMRSLYTGGFYLIGTLFAYSLVIRFSPEELMGLVKMAGVAVCILSGIMVFVFPQHGLFTGTARDNGAWIGIFQDRVSAAKCIVYLLSPALIFGRSRSPWRTAAYAVVLLVFIVMARAVSALGVVAGLACIMGIIQISRRLERKTALLLGTVLIAFALMFALVGVPFLEALLGVFGRDLTLTGRTEIWSILFTSIAKHPILGYGYYAFWQGMNGESANVILAAHWFFGYAHNGILEIFLQLGIVGVALFFLTFLKACKDAWFCMKFGRTAGIEWYCGLLILAVLYNVDEETILWPNDLLSMLYIVACCGLAVESRKIRAELAIQDGKPDINYSLVHDLVTLARS